MIPFLLTLLKYTITIYRTVWAAFWFWLKLIISLKEWVFTQNPAYTRRTLNTAFGKDQCTIEWHVKDLKISCLKNPVVESELTTLNKYYGKTAPLSTITYELVHDYLEMRIDYSEKSKFIITMYDYINKILESLLDDVHGISATSVRNHIFKIDKTNTDKLDETISDLFHHYTTQLLFLSKWTRADPQTAMAFLCTSTRLPGRDDYKKLTCVTTYL